MSTVVAAFTATSCFILLHVLTSSRASSIPTAQVTRKPSLEVTLTTLTVIIVADREVFVVIIYLEFPIQVCF